MRILFKRKSMDVMFIEPSCLPKAAGIKERYCQTVHAWLAISENGVVCYKVR